MPFQHPCRRFLALLLFLPAIVLAGAPQDSIDIQQAFLDLSNHFVAMDLSAHPDDEDGSTLAYLRMKRGVRTYSVLFTRGEGGQNEKGPELYGKLGVLRSRETEEAGKILGAEVRFLNFLDFGYSKTSTETFEKWGGPREVLRRLVYVIRKYKPDVLFTNHNTIDGHGNHQAVAIAAISAFDAAADSSSFPEQLKEPGLTVWQPRKLFFRVGGRAEPTADVVNLIGETDPLRGVGYVDIASEALRKHETQGMERANLRSWTRGKSFYKLMRSNSLYEPDSTSFFSGLDYRRDPAIRAMRVVWDDLGSWRGGMPRDSLLLRASRNLRHLRQFISTGSASALALRMAEEWRREIEHLVTLTCGVRASIVPADSLVVAGQEVKCTLHFASSPQCPVDNVAISSAVPRGWGVRVRTSSNGRPDKRNLAPEFTVQFGDRVLPTVPAEVAQYNSLERQQDVVVRADYTVGGVPLSIDVATTIDVAPPQWLEVSPDVAGHIPGRSTGPLTFAWEVTNFLPRGVSGPVRVELPPGWKSSSEHFTIQSEDDTARGQVAVQPPASVRPGEYPLRFVAAEALATVRVSVFDVNVATSTRLGIIISYDNTLEAASKELGVPYTLLTDADIEKGDLAKFSSIIVDIRAYLVREALQKFNGRLLDYVKNGGNVIVMYQREREWKPEYAPFPFQVTRRRVTVEEAPITMLAPGHPLLTSPNRIAERDWAGWTQERGVYFPDDVPEQYTRLLSTGDPGEVPLTTGYLVAHVGKGSYIYTSLVWYRQLKEQNPGAFRCYANMISYPFTRE